MMHTLTPTADTATDIDDVARLLTPDGERIADRDLDPWVQDVDAAALRSLYRDMTLVRRIDAEGIALQRQGQLGLWAPCQGQEATQVGTARAFRSDDFVFPSYREIGVNFVRGAVASDFVLAWRGEAHSTFNPYDINTATPQIIIGTVDQIGIPIEPGTACWTGRLDGVQVLGLASCELFGRPGAVDLLLPRLLLGEPLTRELVARLGVGGLIESLPVHRALTV